MLARIALIGLVSLLSACFSFGGSNGTSHQVYVLHDAATFILPAHAIQPHVLVIDPTYSNSYDDDIHLVYSRQDDTRGHYQYAEWSELPSSRMSELIFNRLSQSGIYHIVLNARNDADADRSLSTELLDCYHDAHQNPGSAIIRLRADLYNQNTHQLIARKIFTARAPVAQYTSAGAAMAFNQAEAHLLDALSEWLIEQGS